MGFTSFDVVAKCRGILKTKKSLFDAFVELRSQKPLEKITVKEITDAAHISKQTFYLHYKDIYDLADQIESELIEQMCQDLPNIENIMDNIGFVTVTLFKRAIAFSSAVFLLILK